GEVMQGKATIEIPATHAETVFFAVSRLAVPFSVRRLDLCLDFDGLPFLSGQDAIVHTLENWPYTGRRPLHHKIDDMGQGTGSTLYVGRREGECMVRWYEKGKQMRDPFRQGWCRFEIELKPSKPELAKLFWSMLKDGRRGELAASSFSAAFLPFFAGAENVSKVIDVLPSRPRSFDDRIMSMVTQWGGLFGEMLERAGGDRAEVADMIFDAMREKARREKLVRNMATEASQVVPDIPY
ncbi:replication initiation factor domain-containing protein, partial [Vogesella indigofera]